MSAVFREILDAQDRVVSGDVASLARRITALLNDPAAMQAAAKRNLQTARDYLDSTQAPNREAFYKAIIAAR